MSTFSPARPGNRPERGPARTTPRRAPPALFTINEVARHLGSSTRHVRRLIERGELPVHRLGRLVRVSPDDLARYLAACRES
jgi:excisionase family DNA binding protein